MIRRILLLAALALLISLVRFPNPKATSEEGGELALQYLLEWATWMAGIQTAALGGLALFFRSEDKTSKYITEKQRQFALSAFVFLGLGLFLTAWILSSLPSLAVRMHAPPAPGVDELYRYDVYEQDLYGWIPLKLAYFMTAQHWFWALGLLSLGAYIISRFAETSALSGGGGGGLLQSAGEAANPVAQADG